MHAHARRVAAAVTSLMPECTWQPDESGRTRPWKWSTTLSRRDGYTSIARRLRPRTSIRCTLGKPSCVGAINLPHLGSADSVCLAVDLILGHGASGTAQSMRPWVEALAPSGIQALAIDLPRGKAERAVPAYRAELEKHPDAAIGGHSFGGRVASLIASEQPIRALVLLSYPLHRPGHPEDLRTEHWPAIACPVLFLSGDSDPFAVITLLRESIRLVPNAELVTYPGIGHGLIPVIEDAAATIAAFLRRNL